MTLRCLTMLTNSLSIKIYKIVLEFLEYSIVECKCVNVPFEDGNLLWDVMEMSSSCFVMATSI